MLTCLSVGQVFALSALRIPVLSGMLPVKPTKTSAEKRRSRAPGSTWAQSGAKKAERTNRWRMSKFSIQFVLFERFLKDHKLSYESLLCLLAAHFDEGVPIDSQDDSLAGEKKAATAMEREEVEAEGPIGAQNRSPTMKRASSSSSSSSGYSAKSVRKEAEPGAVAPPTLRYAPTSAPDPV